MLENELVRVVSNNVFEDGVDSAVVHCVVRAGKSLCLASGAWSVVVRIVVHGEIGRFTS